MTIAAALDRRGGWDVHAIDATEGLRALAGMRSARSVVRADDHEAVRRLLDELTHREPLRPTLLLLDGFGSFEEQQTRINRGEAIELFLGLTEQGPRRRIAVALTARRRSEVPPAPALTRREGCTSKRG